MAKSTVAIIVLLVATVAVGGVVTIRNKSNPVTSDFTNTPAVAILVNTNDPIAVQNMKNLTNGKTRYWIISEGVSPRIKSMTRIWGAQKIVASDDSAVLQSNVATFLASKSEARAYAIVKLE